MSQEQPRRQQGEAIKNGDVFDVSGQLASQPITPQDAATFQAAENIVLGQIPKGGGGGGGGAAAVMQSAADLNEWRGQVGHQGMANIVRDEGATMTEADAGGYRFGTEAVGKQVVGQYGASTEVKMNHPAWVLESDAITIGEALEATALAAGDKPIDSSDAAAIQAAEVRASGLGHVIPGGIGAEAQSAAAYNVGTTCDEDKTKLGDVLTDATEKLSVDKPATREDAEGVIYAEIRNKDGIATHPGGVAASVAAAARLNQEK